MKEVNLTDPIEFSKGMFFDRCKPFEAVDEERIFKLMIAIKDKFSEVLGRDSLLGKKIFVTYNRDYPCYSSTTDGKESVIFIMQRDNNLIKWCHQFAHEFCHHLFTPQSKDFGLTWFEEVICHVSTFYFVRMMQESLVASEDDQLLPYLNKESLVHNVSAFLRQTSHLLYVEPECRGVFDPLAQTIVPLFEDNPNLWKIVLHSGDMSLWQSLEQYLNHLSETAEPSYQSSLNDLRDLLLT